MKRLICFLLCVALSALFFTSCQAPGPTPAIDAGEQTAAITPTVSPALPVFPSAAPSRGLPDSEPALPLPSASKTARLPKASEGEQVIGESALVDFALTAPERFTITTLLDELRLYDGKQPVLYAKRINNGNYWLQEARKGNFDFLRVNIGDPEETNAYTFSDSGEWKQRVLKVFTTDYDSPQYDFYSETITGNEDRSDFYILFDSFEKNDEAAGAEQGVYYLLSFTRSVKSKGKTTKYFTEDEIKKCVESFMIKYDAPRLALDDYQAELKAIQRVLDGAADPELKADLEEEFGRRQYKQSPDFFNISDVLDDGGVYAMRFAVSTGNVLALSSVDMVSGESLGVQYLYASGDGSEEFDLRFLPFEMDPKEWMQKMSGLGKIDFLLKLRNYGITPTAWQIERDTSYLKLTDLGGRRGKDGYLEECAVSEQDGGVYIFQKRAGGVWMLTDYAEAGSKYGYSLKRELLNMGDYDEAFLVSDRECISGTETSWRGMSWYAIDRQREVFFTIYSGYEDDCSLSSKYKKTIVNGRPRLSITYDIAYMSSSLPSGGYTRSATTLKAKRANTFEWQNGNFAPLDIQLPDTFWFLDGKRGNYDGEPLGIDIKSAFPAEFKKALGSKNKVIKSWAQRVDTYALMQELADSNLTTAEEVTAKFPEQYALLKQYSEGDSSVFVNFLERDSGLLASVAMALLSQSDIGINYVQAASPDGKFTAHTGIIAQKFRDGYFGSSYIRIDGTNVAGRPWEYPCEHERTFFQWSPNSRYLAVSSVNWKVGNLMIVDVLDPDNFIGLFYEDIADMMKAAPSPKEDRTDFGIFVTSWQSENRAVVGFNWLADTGENLRGSFIWDMESLSVDDLDWKVWPGAGDGDSGER